MENNMTFENEREVKMVEFDIDLDNDTREKLLDLARVQILEDEDALLNWVINKLLKEMVERGESTDECSSNEG
jgi:hypothetical protein